MKINNIRSGFYFILLFIYLFFKDERELLFERNVLMFGVFCYWPNLAHDDGTYALIEFFFF